MTLRGAHEGVPGFRQHPIVKPRVHLFGHIHEDGGAWQLDGTWFVNCTTWECERAPTVIEYDEVERRVLRVLAPAHGRRG